MKRTTLRTLIGILCIFLILGVVVCSCNTLQIGEPRSTATLLESATVQTTENQSQNESGQTEMPSDNHSKYLQELEQTLSSPSTVDAIVVPDDYSTIQRAVNYASDGDMVFVRKGQYNETVTINKSLWLVGEDNQSIVDAYSVAPDMVILHDNVNITGFTLKNTPIPAEGHPMLPGYVPSEQLPDIQIINSSYCNIFGNNLVNSSVGVCIEGSPHISVIRNEIRNNGKGVELKNSKDNHITKNIIKGRSGGIILKSATNNSVVNTTITETSYAIWLNSASDNYLRDNTLENNFLNFAVKGGNLSAFINDVDTSNTIDGKPIYYWIGESNQAVPSDAACIILVNCSGITVHDFELPLNRRGIVLVNTNSSSIKSNKLASYNSTRYKKESLNCLFFRSFDNIIENNLSNIYLDSSSNNRIAHNKGIIHLAGSDFNSITENHVIKISFVTGDWSGIKLSKSSHNQIKGNTIEVNQRGIILRNTSSNNYVIENEIRDNYQGGIINGASNTIIFGNIVTTNGNWGIVDSGQNTRIIANEATKNGGWGIMLIRHADNSTVIGNEIGGFSLGGISYKNPTNCRIIGNNISIHSLYSQYRVCFLSIYPAMFHHNNFFCEIDMREEVNHIWDNGTEGNFWINYTGKDSDQDGIGDTPYKISQNNTDLYPLMTPVDIENFTKSSYDFGVLEPPKISVISPENQTYLSGTVSLNFNVNKPTIWTGYSLDDQNNVTIHGNTTLSDLPEDIHTLTVYANDTAGNMGASNTVYFTVAERGDHFLLHWVLVALAITVAGGMGVWIYRTVNSHSGKIHSLRVDPQVSHLAALSDPDGSGDIDRSSIH